MTNHIPPAHTNIAASLDWETATLGDLLCASAATGIQAGALYRAIHHLARINTERVGDT